MGLYGGEVAEKLGAGAFGTVYKMDSPADEPFHSQHPIVAVKEIRVSKMSIIFPLSNNLTLSSYSESGR